MKTLAIETSCDDTSIWIINFDGNIFTVENLLAYSQVKEHNEFGWVVPEIASRLHSEKIIAVLTQIWWDNIQKVDNICVTSHPWLPWSLVVWKTVASLLWEYFQKPIIHVNHIIWHIFALFLERDIHEIKFPMIILTASWWHNNIYYIEQKHSKEDLIPHPNSLLIGEGKYDLKAPLLIGEGLKWSIIKDKETKERQYKWVPEYVKILAKKLRKKQTKTEEILREILRNKQVEWLKFRRQHPFWRYIADFFCNDLNLVIEVDWKIHEKQKEYDNIRDEFIKSYDVNILRITTEEINNNLEWVIQKILNTSPNSITPHPDPLLEGEGEENEKNKHPTPLSFKEREVKSEVLERSKGWSIVRWNYEITQIWQTLDDAAWECFDKVSRMLWWPYPWWVRISQQAKRWMPNERFKLNRIRLSNDKFDFSFSWLKSQVNYLINKKKASITIPINTCSRFDLNDEAPLFNPQETADIAYEFQESVVEVLWKKLVKAALKYWAKTIWLSGWVSANDRLQEYILELLENKQRLQNQIPHPDDKNTSPDLSLKERRSTSKIPLLLGEGKGVRLLTPTKKLYCTDNAAMIWVAWILK
jgi:tRNA A37 threonylcarbamoyltransferase TsaD/very-short-patch-repair endonuclease